MFIDDDYVVVVADDDVSMKAPLVSDHLRSAEGNSAIAPFMTLNLTDNVCHPTKIFFHPAKFPSQTFDRQVHRHSYTIHINTLALVNL